MQPVRIIIEGDSIIIRAPQSFAPWIAIDKITATGIRLGAWPADVYAGRLTIWGERLQFQHMKALRA